jgi:hypothetical protein
MSVETVQTVRLTNLRYFVSQLSDALFDRILHEGRLAEDTRPTGSTCRTESQIIET